MSRSFKYFEPKNQVPHGKTEVLTDQFPRLPSHYSERNLHIVLGTLSRYPGSSVAVITFFCKLPETEVVDSVEYLYKERFINRVGSNPKRYSVNNGLINNDYYEEKIVLDDEDLLEEYVPQP